MNTQISLVVSNLQIGEQKFELKLADDAIEPIAEVPPIPSGSIVDQPDPEKLNLRSQEQSKHLVGAERAAVNFWRNARAKDDSHHATGYSKFESCAYVVKAEKQLHENPGMGLELECLSSFLSASNKNKILQNYASIKYE